VSRRIHSKMIAISKMWCSSILLLAAFLSQHCFVEGFSVNKISSISPITSTTTKLNSAPPGFTVEGLQKKIVKEGNGVPVRLGDIATVKYSCYLPADGSGTTNAPFAKARDQKIVVGDGNMILGWEKAIRTMMIGERSIVRINNPELGYGMEGFPPLIPPNAEIELDLEILDAKLPTANIDFDSLAMSDSTPRTANDIAAAYQVRQIKKARDMENTVQKEGLEAFIEKAKNFYFFGLFEGETGERPPWFLTPSITFPIAFLVVGVTFYISFAVGGITQRGLEAKDDLDDIILESSNIFSNGVNGDDVDGRGVLLMAFRVLVSYGMYLQ